MKMNYEKLSEHCEVFSGYAFKSQDLQSEGDIPVVKIGNISNGKDVILDNDTQYVDKRLLSINEKYHIRKGDVLISLTGSHINQPNSMVGRSCRYYQNQELLLNQRAGKVLAKDNNDLSFLYYMFSSWAMKINITNRAYGAANQANVSPTDISNIKFNFPEYEIQKKIGYILSCYDETIENNNKRIKLLEQMAQNLYKEWFVRFRFPGHENCQFKPSSIGKIPTSFNVLKQNEVISDYIGGGWGEGEESANFPIQAAVVRGADFPEFTKGDISTCPVRFHKKSNYESRVIAEDDIVLEVSGGTQEQPVGRTVIVTKERLERFYNKLICASFCKLVRLNKKVVAPFFYYYWMQFVYETRMIDRYQLQSTGIINFKFEYFLRKGDVLQPPSDLMWEFDAKVRTIHKQIETLAMANENLVKQRDLLLPRLMGGKVEVK